MLVWWSLWPLKLLLRLMIRSVCSFRGCFVSKPSSFLSFVVHRMVWHWRGTDGGRLSAPFDSKQDYFLSSKREALFRPRSAFSLSHFLTLSLSDTHFLTLSQTPGWSQRRATKSLSSSSSKRFLNKNIFFLLCQKPCSRAASDGCCRCCYYCCCCWCCWCCYWCCCSFGFFRCYKSFRGLNRNSPKF